MKVVILAGGFGTRLSEETDIKPKPMVHIGEQPILWHIMKIYSSFGFHEFILCLGYKAQIIKEYFYNYHFYHSDVTLDLKDNSHKIHKTAAEPWKITFVDTGHDTMTGGRVKRVQQYLENETFMLTYGDGVSNVDINQLVDFHQKGKKFATVTAVQPLGRFGALELGDSDQVLSFQEKPRGDGSWINGGFFVLEPEIFDYIDDDSTMWEREPLERLANDQQLNAFRHNGFWKPMDTLRDKRELEAFWKSGKAAWKVWNE